MQTRRQIIAAGSFGADSWPATEFHVGMTISVPNSIEVKRLLMVSPLMRERIST